ncbi:unnamed protein product [Rhizophagus irregularis]|nr:unnamed protein product [Rhizophagus irregularis]
MCQLYGLGESDDPSLSIRNIVSEFDLEKKFAGLKESSDLEDEKQKSETTNVKDFAVKLGLDKFTKNKEEWKKFYDFAGSDFVWPQPPDINERRLIFDYVVDPYWEPIGSELAVNALEYRRLLDSGSLDQSREYVLIVHGKFVRYGSSEEEKKMRVDYPGCYYVPVKERIVELRRFSASDVNTNAGAEKEWQVHIRLRNTDDNLDEAGMANVERAPEYERFLYSELCLRKCQSVQQNFAQMYDISKNFFILYDEFLIFAPNLAKMYIQSN